MLRNPSAIYLTWRTTPDYARFKKIQAQLDNDEQEHLIFMAGVLMHGGCIDLKEAAPVLKGVVTTP